MMQREGFSVTEACRQTGLSRAGFYRDHQEHQPRQADVELRDAIPENRDRESFLRLPARDRRAAPAGLGRQPQAGDAADARR